jgi:hypothetical protein
MRKKVRTDDLLGRTYALMLYAARQYVTKQTDLPTSRPASRDNVGAIDLGWREPEKQKRRKKKGNAVGASDGTDGSEERKAAKVRLPCVLLNVFILSGGAGTPNASLKGAICALKPRSYVTIRRTGARDAEDADGQGT